jgi:hypothetical protein
MQLSVGGYGYHATLEGNAAIDDPASPSVLLLGAGGPGELWDLRIVYQLDGDAGNGVAGGGVSN